MNQRSNEQAVHEPRESFPVSPPPIGSSKGSRKFPCPGCGADLVFHIGSQAMNCGFCGFTRELSPTDHTAIEEHDLQNMLKRMAAMREEGVTGEIVGSEIKCNSCGANVHFVGTLTATHCAYCGGPLQRDDIQKAEYRIPVDAMLPFSIDRGLATANLTAWTRSRWFAPNAFKRLAHDPERLSGIYLPYWTYDSLTFNRYAGMRGDHYWVTVGSGKNRRRVRKTRWSHASGNFQRFFDDMLIVAATGVPAERITALEPWPLKKCMTFNPEALAGFLARTYDVPIEEGFGLARVRMDDAIEQEVRSRIGGDEQRISQIETSHEAVTFKHVLLPSWMMAYRFKDKTYQVVINAITGEVQADRPYSIVKIALTILLTMILGAAVAWLFSRK